MIYAEDPQPSYIEKDWKKLGSNQSPKVLMIPLSLGLHRATIFLSKRSPPEDGNQVG